jgi:hypothetical protein
VEKTEFDDLPWEEIKEISEKGLFEEVFKRIPKERFRFAAKEENREALVNSAHKSLKKNNPEASYEQAELLANLMQQFARRVLEG